MKPNVYSPLRGCLMIATSLKALEFWSVTESSLWTPGSQKLRLESKLIVLTWWYCCTDLFRSSINIANERHFLDKPFTQTKHRSSQPWGHEHTDQEDESDGGQKSKTCKLVEKKLYSSEQKTDPMAAKTRWTIRFSCQLGCKDAKPWIGLSSVNSFKVSLKSSKFFLWFM